MRLLWWLAAAIVLLEGLLLAIDLPLRPSGFALQFAWTPRNFGEIMHVWSPAELARYRSHLPIDYLLLLAYGCFGWLAVRRCRFYAALGEGWRRLVARLLPLAAFFDSIENAFHWWLTEVPRFGIPWAYLASASSAGLKWLLIVLFCALSLWAWGKD